MPEEVSPPQPTTETAPPSKPKRPLRRKLLMLGAGVLGGVVLLVALAPTLLTSGPAMSFAESKFLDKTGRPIELNGISAGWFSDIRAGEITIPALPAEGSSGPMLRLTGLHVPMTLIDVIGGPPYSIPKITADEFEANIVRFDDGRTNAQIVAESASSGDDAETTSTTEKSSPLPIKDFEFAIAKTSVRFHDDATGQMFGLIDSSFDGEWKGPGQSLVSSIVGNAVANNAQVPVDIAIGVADWTDANGVLTAQNADVSLRVLLAKRTQPFLEGGVQQKPEGRSFLARFEIDTATMIPSARTYTGKPDLPDVTGIVRGDVRVRGIGGPRIAPSFTLSTSAITVPGIEGRRVTLPDLTAQGSADVAMSESLLDSAAATISTTGLSAQVLASQLPFSGPDEATQLTVKLDASLEPFTLAAMKAAGMEATAAPASGALSISATTRSGLAGGPAKLDISGMWRGGQLRTLAPFAEDPPALAAKPLDLGPTSMDIAGEIDFNPADRSFGTPGLTITAPHLGEGKLTLVGSAPEGLAPSYAGVAEMAVRLAGVRKAMGDFAPPQLGDLEGTGTVQLQVRYAPGRPIGVQAAIALDPVTISLNEPKLALLTNESASIEADLSFEPTTSALDISKIALRSPFATLDGSGKHSPAGSEGNATLQVPLERAFQLASAVKPIDALQALNGSLEGSLTVSGTQISPRVVLDTKLIDSTATLADGTAIALPAKLALDATPDLSNPDSPRVHITSSALDWGDAAHITLSGDAGREGISMPVMLDGTARLSHAQIIALVPEPMRANIPPGLAIDGDSNVTFSMRGDASTDPKIVNGLQANVTLKSEIPTFAMESPQGPVAIQSQQIGGTIDAEITPANPALARYVVTLDHKAAQVSGPMGLEITSLDSSLRAEGVSTDRLNLMPGFNFESLRADTGTMRIALPRTRAAFDIRTLEAFQKLRIESSTLSIGELASWKGTGGFDRTSLAWDVNGELRVANLADAIALASPAEGADPLPTMRGTFGADIKLAGGADPLSAISRGDPPFTGNAEIRLSDLAFETADGKRADSLTATISLAAERNVVATFNAAIGALRAAPAPAPELTAVKASAKVALDNMDTLRATDINISAGNTSTSFASTLSIAGLRPIVARAIEDVRAKRPVAMPAEISEWLAALTIESAGTANVDVAFLSGMSEGITMSGPLSGEWTMASRPGQQARLGAKFRMGGLDAASTGVWDVTGTSGTLALAKTLRLTATSGRAPDPPPVASFIRHIGFSNPPFTIDIRDLKLITRAADNGIRVQAETPFMNGGPARFDGRITLINGEPVLEGDMQSTALDVRTMLPPPAKNASVPLELDTVSRIRWDLGRTARTGNFFEGLDLTMNSPRIDKQALTAIVRALTPISGEAATAAADAAIRYGAPTDSALTLKDGMLSFAITIQPLGSPVAVKLPVVQRASVGKLVKTYDFGPIIEKISTMRTALSLLLAESLADFEAQMAERNQAP